jgi:hypothetical protein
MTFRYTDPDGHEIETQPEEWDGQPVVAVWIRGEFATVPARIPVDHVEEFIAGLRDTARHAATGSPDHRHAAALHVFGTSDLPEQP